MRLNEGLLRWMKVAPTVARCVYSLPPKGAAAPAVWQSQFRSPCLKGEWLVGCCFTADIFHSP